MNKSKLDEVVLETSRMVLRKVREDDFNELCEMLQDTNVMYAWEKIFSDKEVKEWIKTMQRRYELDGYAYYVAINKESSEVIGQIGLLNEVVEGKNYMGLGYILKRKHWGYGYAKEGCKALISYAFDYFDTQEVIAEIRPENQNSIFVAESLGMEVMALFNKTYNGKVMPHLIYKLNRIK